MDRRHAWRHCAAHTLSVSARCVRSAVACDSPLGYETARDRTAGRFEDHRTVACKALEVADEMRLIVVAGARGDMRPGCIGNFPGEPQCTLDAPDAQEGFG